MSHTHPLIFLLLLGSILVCPARAGKDDSPDQAYEPPPGSAADLQKMPDIHNQADEVPPPPTPTPSPTPKRLLE